MNSPKSPLEFSFSKIRHSSLTNIRPIADPFAVLCQSGSKLKPVSPKLKFPRQSHHLPPRPHQKENSLINPSIKRVQTPSFQSMHGKNTTSLCDLNKKIKKTTENTINGLCGHISPSSIKKKYIRSY